MKNFFLIFFLIAFAFGIPQGNKSIKKEIRNKLINCIISTEGISENLKKNINDIKKSKGLNPIIFNKIKMEENDMEIVRSCKRQIFQEIRNNKKNNQ